MTLSNLKKKLPVLWSYFFPLRIVLDGRDNTVTVNHNLLRLLYKFGIRNNNHIYSFHLWGGRYGFTLLPPNMDAAKTICTSLIYNSETQTTGFELLCPTAQLMLHTWNMDPDSVLRLKVKLHYAATTDRYYFSIIPPKQ